MDKKKAFETLGIQENATLNDVNKAFRKRSMETHRDLNPGKEDDEFKEVYDAYSKITSLVDVKKEFIYEIKKKMEIQMKRNNTMETISLNLIKERNSKIESIRRSTTKLIYIAILGPVPVLIAILTILQATISMTEISPYALIVYLIAVIIAIFTLMDQRDVRIRDTERNSDDTNREIAHELKNPEDLKKVYSNLKKIYCRKKEPMNIEEILNVIRESTGRSMQRYGLRDRDTIEKYTMYILMLLRSNGYIQSVGNKRYIIK